MNPELATQLRQLIQRDTETRSQLLAKNQLYGIYHQSMQSVHRENAFALDQIVSDHGWPGISLVGKEGCRDAWQLAQHSICTPDLQRKFLQLLTRAAQQGDVPRRQVAMLTDRIRFNEDRPQVYGTVFDWDEKGVFGCRIEDSENVDRRRQQVGLPSYRESLQQNTQAVAAEGGKPPQDYAGYRKSFLAWAESVGWR